MTTAQLRAVRAHPAADLFGLTEALCAVPSVFPEEGALADAIEARLRANAAALDTTRVANNIVVRTQFGCAQRLVIGGHIDTVPPNNNAMPTRRGDTLHGLGAADMKGGLAVMLRLAEALSARQLSSQSSSDSSGDVSSRAASQAPNFDVTLFWYEGEEVAEEHNGLRAMFATVPELVAGDFAILMEPTGGWVEAGCQGTLHLRATYRGARAHTARPWMGRNAIHSASEALAVISAHDPGTSMVDGLSFRESVQVVHMSGGVANNVVPDVCELIVNRRFAPCWSSEQAEAQLRALLVGADDIVRINLSPAAAPNLMNPLVAQFIGTLDLAVRPKLGWTDVARFASRGIPAVNFGPGDPTLAHTAQECVDRQEIDGCYAALARFIGIG